MYVLFLQSTHCIKKTLTVSCMLLCESGDRVKVDLSLFSADMHAVMLRHQCSEFAMASASSLFSVFLSTSKNALKSLSGLFSNWSKITTPCSCSTGNLF